MRVSHTLVAVSLCLTAAVANTAKAGWEEERERLRDLIEHKTLLEVGRQLAPAKVAERLELPYPVPEPTRTMDEVKQAAAKAAREDLDAEHPPQQLEEFRQTAEEQYELWKEGEQVSFVIRGGRGPNTLVEGRLRHVGVERVQVGNRWISRSDIDEETLARLDPQIHQDVVEAYVRRKAMTRQLARERLFEEKYPEHGKRLMKESNYVQWKGQWMPAVELFEKALEYHRGTLADEIRPRIEQEIFGENGYVQREGEWVPKNLLGRLKGAFGGGKDDDTAESGPVNKFFQGLK